jgi:hypothetical protein
MSSVDVAVRERVTLDWIEHHHVALAGVLFAGILVRGWGLGTESLWYDEIFVVPYLHSLEPYGIAMVLPQLDPHPPLYYVLLDLWVRAVGVSDVGLRSLSTVLDVGSIGVVYLLTRRLYDRRVGLVAAGLFALSPFYVWYGREARMYALATLLALTSTYLLVRMGDGDRRWRTASGYLLATVALAHTHAFAPLVVLGQNVYLAGAFLAGLHDGEGVPRRVGDLSLPRWVGLQVLVGIASAPYYALLYHHTFVTERFTSNVAWVPAADPTRLWTLFGTYLGRTVPPVEPWGYESLWAYGPGDVLTVVGELVTLAGLFLAAYALYRRVHGGTDRSGSGSGFSPGPLLAAWALTPVLTLYALSVFARPVLYDRFTAVAGVAFLVLVARGLTLLADSRRTVAVVGAATLLVLAVPLAGLHAGPQKPQTETAVSVIEANAGEEDLVLASPQWDNSARYYLADMWNPPDQAATPEHPPSWNSELEMTGVAAGAGEMGLRQAVGYRDTVWLVASFQSGADVQTTVESMRGIGYEVTRHEDLEKVDLYRFERAE